MPDGVRRWPVHPEPGPGEALTSWLGRLAGLYGLSVEQLLPHNLGSASARFDRGADLDYQTPTIIVHALAERTGVAMSRLRRMTIAGCVPWLADTLNPADGQKGRS
ncbi:TniQ family protein [Nonomuraea sp. NPDC046570]|uniref:TniQ family protein n=1 Tax=Nonomuraea sp. NPDC046570 TaxID=3155255 RepID=UPI0033E8F759